MMIRSRSVQRFSVLIAFTVLIAACSGDGPDASLSGVTVVNTPEADTTTRVNFNSTNPTLKVQPTVPVKDGDVLTLVWNDEFNGTQLNNDDWFFETGDGSQYGIPGWGNNELQWYLPDNARLEDGKLIIDAKRESVGDFRYTSARINTRDRIAVKYGRIEARIKLPAGQGVWPAFWMFPQSDLYGTFSASGEIDIVEAVNLDANPSPSGLGGGNEIFSTIHYGGEFPNNLSSSEEYEPSEDVTEGFNNYAVEWDETEIRWYFNGILSFTQNSTWSSTGGSFPAPFDQPFYILLNVAVGGNFPGPPDGLTPFPATMEVDWVRVFRGEFTPASAGVIPDAVVFNSNDRLNADLAPPGFDNFGSGARFDTQYTGDVDFSPALEVTSGEGYGSGTHVGFVAFTGYGAGFASSYDTLHFKVKAKAENLAAFEVKFFAPDTTMNYDLTSYSGATDIGNGWLQVSIPMSDFSANISANDGFLLGPLGGQVSSFNYLMTDIGFSNSAPP